MLVVALRLFALVGWRNRLASSLMTFVVFSYSGTMTGCQKLPLSTEAPPVSPEAFRTVERTKHSISFQASPQSGKSAELSERTPRPDDWFVDVTRSSGMDFSYQNGRSGGKFTLLESIGGGVACFDIDNDGDVDLFITGGGTIGGSPMLIGGLSCGLFRNEGELVFTDITAVARVNSAENYTLAGGICDFNCDGCPDLFVTGYPHCKLYRNLGDGTLQDVTGDSGLTVDGLHSACTWGDFDGDGLPDLFLAGYVIFDLREDRSCGDELRNIRDICGIWQYPPSPDRLFRNRGDGTFEEITQPAGLRADGRGLGAVAADINDDGHLDLYVANDYTPNFLYLGDGRGTFIERGLLSGTAFDENGIPQGSMGVDFGDFDGDGLGDLFVTNYQLEDNTLYRNLGNGNFSVATPHVGLQDVCRRYVGFGTGWVDWDSDGWLDLFVLNGHVMYSTGQSTYEQPQFLFQNVAGKRFVNVSENGGPYFSGLHVARGGAFGDLDNDGAPDLVVVHQNSPVTLLRNLRPPTRWFRVCLRGTTSDPLAVGAVLTAKFDGRTLTRHVCGGAGYFSQFDQRILLPVDIDGPIQCSVRWLNGQREIFAQLQLCQTNLLVEGQGELERPVLPSNP